MALYFQKEIILLFHVNLYNVKLKCTFRFKIDIKFKRVGDYQYKRKLGKIYQPYKPYSSFYYDLSNVIDNFKYGSDMV